MVKGVIGEETRFQLLDDRLTKSSPPAEVGLLIGKFSSALDRVFLFDLIPTPHNDSGEPASSITQPDKKTASKSKSQTPDSSSLFIDKDWVSEHARQVSRMLVGGIKVVGVYVWVNDNAFKNSTIMLCQVNWGERLLLQICYGPRRWNCRNCSLSSNITSSSLRPCDFKMGKVLSSFQTFRCMHNFNLRLPILHDGSSKFQTLSDALHYAISVHAKELSDAKSLIDAYSQRDVSGILSFSGTICSFAYLNSKEPISQAVTDIKGDIITSLQSRLDIICDETDVDSGNLHDVAREVGDADVSVEKPVSQHVLHLLRRECNLPFPRRVFAPWLAGTYVCDYLQPSETVEVLKDHCMELLSMKPPTEVSTILEPEKEVISFKTKSFWDVAVPYYSEIHLMDDKMKLDSRGESSSDKLGKPGHISVVAAGLILLLSVLVGFVLFVLKG
ncbi:hypothetical protein TSUD_308820 [Trifolium subterraneum]|nr:hypothetical protein TSUD_308820 [Trifolium subterraneum]